ncbi:MAG: hypothetical protein WCS69_04895 [Ignavibacteriaceae bacterium]|jgi:hypothetical protein
MRRTSVEVKSLPVDTASVSVEVKPTSFEMRSMPVETGLVPVETRWMPG